MDNSKPNQYFEKRYSIPVKIFDGDTKGRVTIKFSSKSGSGAGAACIYDVRLMKPDSRPGAPAAN